jgi:hypothetical protein
VTRSLVVDATWAFLRLRPPKEVRIVTRTTPAARIAFVAAIVLALALVPVALAGKGQGGNKGGGSTTSSGNISLVLLNSTDGLPHFRQQVTFNISTTASQPYVDATCYQNGAVVYDEWHGMWPGAMFGTTFTLGPTQSWSGGDADCTARIVVWATNGKQIVLGSMTFHVYA